MWRNGECLKEIASRLNINYNIDGRMAKKRLYSVQKMGTSKLESFWRSFIVFKTENWRELTSSNSQQWKDFYSIISGIFISTVDKFFFWKV